MGRECPSAGPLGLSNWQMTQRTDGWVSRKSSPRCAPDGRNRIARILPRRQRPGGMIVVVVSRQGDVVQR